MAKELHILDALLLCALKGGRPAVKLSCRAWAVLPPIVTIFSIVHLGTYSPVCISTENYSWLLHNHIDLFHSKTEDDIYCWKHTQSQLYTLTWGSEKPIFLMPPFQNIVNILNYLKGFSETVAYFDSYVLKWMEK